MRSSLQQQRADAAVGKLAQHPAGARPLVRRAQDLSTRWRLGDRVVAPDHQQPRLVALEPAGVDRHGLASRDDHADRVRRTPRGAPTRLEVGADSQPDVAGPQRPHSRADGVERNPVEPHQPAVGPAAEPFGGALQLRTAVDGGDHVDGDQRAVGWRRGQLQAGHGRIEVEVEIRIGPQAVDGVRCRGRGIGHPGMVAGARGRSAGNQSELLRGRQLAGVQVNGHP